MLLHRPWLPRLVSSLLLAASLSVGVWPGAAHAEHRDRHARREHRRDSDRGYHRDSDREYRRDSDRDHRRDSDREHRHDGDRRVRFRPVHAPVHRHARWQAPHSEVAFRFAISNVAPVGYGYYDAYCDRDFDSLALYVGHLGHCRHPRILQVVDAGAGCPVASYGYRSGTWVRFGITGGARF